MLMVLLLLMMSWVCMVHRCSVRLESYLLTTLGALRHRFLTMLIFCLLLDVEGLLDKLLFTIVFYVSGTTMVALGWLTSTSHLLITVIYRQSRVCCILIRRLLCLWIRLLLWGSNKSVQILLLGGCGVCDIARIEIVEHLFVAHLRLFILRLRRWNYLLLPVMLANSLLLRANDYVSWILLT